MKTILTSIEAEFRRYQALADAALSRVSEAELGLPGPGNGNSIAVLAWHIAGNLASRFTDFLTTDGEKPWRDRDSEFEPRTPTRQELEVQWERGWIVLFESLSKLTDEQLQEMVVIRGTELRVHEALHRSLAHVSYHVGQVVYQARALRGADWKSLSISPGGSEAYSRNPVSELPERHSSELKERP
jgi:hypothetical protein